MKILTNFHEDLYDVNDNQVLIKGKNFKPYELFCIRSKLSRKVNDDNFSHIYFLQSENILERRFLVLCIYNKECNILLGYENDLENYKTKFEECKSEYPDFVLFYTVDEISEEFKIPKFIIKYYIEYFLIENLIEYKYGDGNFYVKFNENSFTEDYDQLCEKLLIYVKKKYKFGYFPKELIYKKIKKINLFLEKNNLSEDEFYLKPLWNKYLFKDNILEIYEKFKKEI